MSQRSQATDRASAEELARFLTEAEAVAQLMHPNIALAKAIQLGYRGEVALRHAPDLEELRSRPRFQELLATLRP